MHYAASSGKFEVVKWLSERGVPSTVQDKQGVSPFQVAQKEGYSEIADFLSQDTGDSVTRRRRNNVEIKRKSGFSVHRFRFSFRKKSKRESKLDNRPQQSHSSNRSHLHAQRDNQSGLPRAHVSRRRRLSSDDARKTQGNERKVMKMR